MCWNEKYVHYLMQISVRRILWEIWIVSNESIAEITGDDTATMQYIHYEEDIVLKKGVELVGWTYEKIINPSSLSSAVQPLRNLHDVIKDKRCRFVRLSAQELSARVVAYQEKVNQGQVIPRQRKTRKDKGIRRRKTMSTATVGEDDNTDDEVPLRKRRRLNNDSEDDSSDAGSNWFSVLAHSFIVIDFNTT